MPYKLRFRKCSNCGAELYGRYPEYAPVRCAECGIAAMTDAIREMADKRGSHYAKWEQTRGPQGRPRKHS